MLARSFNLYGDGQSSTPRPIRPALARGLKVVKEERRLALIDTIRRPADPGAAFRIALTTQD
jgi:hypothetical protein